MTPTTLFPAAAPQAICRDALLEKYAKGTESSVEEVRRRVARALAQAEPEARRAHWERRFQQALEDGFIPAGRINSAAGVQLQATLINCFVQPVGDSISETVDGKPGIYTALQEAAETMRRGGGVGYDFSSIRPQGAQVRARIRRASGPVSYMRGATAPAKTVESAGARRGAQMGVLRCDHLTWRIHPRQGPGDLANFNLSVGVHRRFMQARGGRPRVSSWCTMRSPGRARASPSVRTGCGSTERSPARARCGTRCSLDLRPCRARHPVPRPHEP